MHDSICLEELGVPTAVIVTDEFLREAKAQCDALGLPKMEPVVIDHPLSTLSLYEINERAGQAVPGITSAWLSKESKSDGTGQSAVG